MCAGRESVVNILVVVLMFVVRGGFGCWDDGFSVFGREETR